MLMPLLPPVDHVDDDKDSGGDVEEPHPLLHQPGAVADVNKPVGVTKYYY